MHINTFQIGADPEFVLIDPNTNTKLNADNYIPYSAGQFGTDAGGLVELRPEASYTVKGLLKNIKRLLNNAPESVKGLKWRAGAAYRGGDFYALGGHIHLELPCKGFHGIKDSVYDQRLRALDHVIMELEFHNILPEKECQDRRKNSRYGMFGAVYNVSQNNFTRMEYRTPCSWLFHPHNAFVTITAIKLAAANPEYALEKLGKGKKKERFAALVKFFRAFAPVDDDAAYVVKNILTSVHDRVAKEIEAKPDQDFKDAWAKFSA